MGIFLRGLGVVLATMLATATTVWAQTADPPGRIGRLAFVNGTVSFHDRDETNWAPAALNYPMTSGNALWTEPNGRAEIFVGSTRIRMQGSTQFETLSLTDDQFQLRVSQGRIDVKTVGLQQGQQVEILTPRGSAMLIGDGDYMIEAGTTDDATRVGVRTGSARVIASNGAELLVHPGEIGVLTGTSPPVFETVRQATPPMPAEWASRDRQIVTTQTVQYVPASVTGSEELDYYGTWSTVGNYGRVWSPRTVPTGWEPYRQGRWRWVDPWGWTWIDDQPWAFAPSHYGRWVNQAGRWYWVPPARDARPVYAPAVVGFVDVAGGAATLAIAASVGAPVGWFPLGPREVYMPSYTADRAYIRRLNAAYIPNAPDIDRRIDYAERYRSGRPDDRRDDPRRADPRRDARPGPDSDRDRPTFINQRYATVVPQQAFLRGDRVDRAAIRVDADRLARVQAAPVAAPMVATTAPVAPPTQPGKVPDARPGQPPAPAATPGQPPAQPQGVAVQRAPLANIQVLGRPDRQDRPTTRAPGPQISRTQPAAPGASGAPADRQLPNLRTRDGREVDRPAPSQAAPATPPATPVEPPKPGAPPVAAPPAKPGEEPKAAEPPKPAVTPPVAAPPAKPGEPPKAAEPPKPPQAPATPPVAAPPAKPGEQPKAAEPPKPPQAPVAPPVAAPPKPPVTPPQAAEPPKAPVAPPKAAEPPKPPQAPAAPPVAAPPKPPVTPPQAAQPPSPPAAPPAQQAKPPEPPRPAPQQAAPPPAPPAPPPQARPQAPPPAPPAPPPQQAKPPAPPPAPAAKPPEQAKQPPGRDRDDKGGDDRRR